MLRDFNSLFEGLYSSGIKRSDAILTKVLSIHKDIIGENYKSSCLGSTNDFIRAYAFTFLYASKLEFLDLEYFE